MGTVKRNPFLSGVCAILGGMLLWVGAARGDVTSDRPAAIVVFPKLIFDSRGFTVPAMGQDDPAPTDTEIQLTNVSDQPINARCFYVNANSHCSNSPENVCFTTADCQQYGLGGFCVAGWVETDFAIQLSPRQPIVWRISEGLFTLPLAALGQNTGSIPAVSEDPFYGELKCVEVDENDQPVDRNDLKGEATIVAVSVTEVDARAYNGIGIQAIEGANDGDNTLVLGGDSAEYNGCPSVLILDHFFDDAVEPIDGDSVKTHLTLVPCSENFELQTAALFDTAVQFLVFNEFEQRFSASRKLNCFKEFELCALGTQLDRSLTDVDPASNSCQRSVFSAFVSGTLTGQTRIRGVDDSSTDHGNGVLGVAEEFFRTDSSSLRDIRSSDAFNTHQTGERTRPDIIQLP
jgi:hypothetical protein